MLVGFLLFSLRNADVFWQRFRERPTVHTSQATLSYIRLPSLPLPAAPFRSFLPLLFSFLPCSTSSSFAFPSSFSSASSPVPASLHLVECYCSSPLLLLWCSLLLLFFYTLSVTVTPASRYASSLNRPSERTNERTQRPIPFHGRALLHYGCRANGKKMLHGTRVLRVHLLEAQEFACPDVHEYRWWILSV